MINKNKILGKTRRLRVNRNNKQESIDINLLVKQTVEQGLEDAMKSCIGDEFDYIELTRHFNVLDLIPKFNDKQKLKHGYYIRQIIYDDMLNSWTYFCNKNGTDRLHPFIFTEDSIHEAEHLCLKETIDYLETMVRRDIERRNKNLGEKIEANFPNFTKALIYVLDYFKQYKSK